MSQTRNVVWSEGLFLTPQLFQQADRYRDNLMQFRLNALSPFFWGLAELEIDQESLKTGSLGIVRCNGVMPDGLPVQIPGEENIPDVRVIKPFFAPSAESMDVFLTIPAIRSDTINVHLENGASGRATRFRMEVMQVKDDTVEGNEIEIPVACKNFQILFGGESLDGKVYIKIAELGRTATGEVLLKSYIPPAISLAASGTLLAVLHRILEMLSAKSTSLSQQRRHIAEFGASDIANFWLLHTVNSFVPILSHFYLSPDRHPELLYMALAQLVGELSTFSLQTDARDIPRYEHESLFETFDQLEQKIRFLLETIIPSKYVIIPLTKTPQLWYVGEIQDDRILASAHFYLAANAQVPPTRLIEDVPAKSKISSPDEIGAIIGRAVPGVSVTHEPIPPSSIPVKPGYKYYTLHTSGRWWEAICKARRLALYLPEEFPDLKVELVAVRE